MSAIGSAARGTKGLGKSWPINSPKNKSSESDAKQRSQQLTPVLGSGKPARLKNENKSEKSDSNIDKTNEKNSDILEKLGGSPSGFLGKKQNRGRKIQARDNTYHYQVSPRWIFEKSKLGVTYHYQVSARWIFLALTSRSKKRR